MLAHAIEASTATLKSDTAYAWSHDLVVQKISEAALIATALLSSPIFSELGCAQLTRGLLW
jgi:hypothetical protein